MTTVSWPPSSYRSATTTDAPSRANARAVARPMPELAPVTIGTFPENTPAISGLLFVRLTMPVVTVAGSLAPAGEHGHAAGAEDRAAPFSAPAEDLFADYSYHP